MVSRDGSHRDEALAEFARDEYGARIDRIRRLMAENDLGAILVTSEVNFRYITGYQSQTWISPTRPRYCVLPLKGDPIVVSPVTFLVGMRQTSWISDIRSWPAPRPEDDGVSLVRDAVWECVGRGGRLGAELGPETRLGMPVADFLRLRDAIAPVEVVDAGTIMTRVRMVKSEAEVGRIRRVARIVSKSFDAVPGFLSKGRSEKDVCRDLQIEILRNGADRSPYLVGVSDRGGYPNINVGPSDRLLDDGDMLVIDTGSTLDGYFCDFDREFFLGRPSDQIRQLHEKLWKVTETGIASIRPGRRVCDVWAAMAAALDEMSLGAADVGRMGHGIGMVVTEPPSVHPADTTIIQTGMVLTVEPGLSFMSETANGARKVMVHEENVVVTPDGCELLSVRASPDLTTVL